MTKPPIKSSTDRKTSALYRKKETIVEPSVKEKSAASRDLKRRDPAGGRVMADASVAKRQTDKKQPPKKKPTK